MTFKEGLEIIEAIKKKWVVRKGKKIRKKFTDKAGYKMVGGKEVRMKPAEVRKRKRSAIKGSKKKKSQKASIARSRKISMKKRKTIQ